MSDHLPPAHIRLQLRDQAWDVIDKVNGALKTRQLAFTLIRQGGSDDDYLVLALTQLANASAMTTSPNSNNK